MDDLNIGKKVREFRTLRGINMKELSQRTGITASMLSQIERDQVNPSINTLKVIAQALQMEMFHFFRDDDAIQNMVVRSDQRKTIGLPDSQDVVYELLTPNTQGGIEFCQMIIPKNSTSGEVAQSHVGEETAFVVNGPVEITIGADRYTLDSGDSIRIPPLCAHKWANITEETVRVIFAVSPPSF